MKGSEWCVEGGVPVLAAHKGEGTAGITASALKRVEASLYEL